MILSLFILFRDNIIRISTEKYISTFLHKMGVGGVIEMIGNQKRLAAIIGVAIFLVTTCAATTSLKIRDTPLYTFRMEKASSSMNFLPRERNDFIYDAEDRYTVNYCAGGYCSSVGIFNFGAAMPPVTYDTCWVTCDDYTCYDTCLSTCNTCYVGCDGHTVTPTCLSTCDTCYYGCNGHTVGLTCLSTCDTCYYGCNGYTAILTCPVTCDTCWVTCDGYTCYLTCVYTCANTCYLPCHFWRYIEVA